MAVVNQIDRVIANEGKIVDGRNMVDMRVIYRIDMDKARNVALAATKVEFHECCFQSLG